MSTLSISPFVSFFLPRYRLCLLCVCLRDGATLAMVLPSLRFRHQMSKELVQNFILDYREPSTALQRHVIKLNVFQIWNAI